MLNDSFISNKIPLEAYPGEWEWLSQKWSMSNISVPVYHLSTFTGNIINMPITGEFAFNGHCLIEVLIFKEVSNLTEGVSRFATIAMIDSGASHTMISGSLANTLGLDRKDIRLEVQGFDNTPITECAKAGIMIPLLFNNSVFNPYFPIKEGMESSSFNIVIGADFLRHMKFERDGPAGIFTLTV